MILEAAPAKLNLFLRVGMRRADGLHPLCSVFASLDLEDEVRVEATQGQEDGVSCPGVPGENLAARALAAFRTAVPGAGLPPLQVTILKRIPVAAGLGGGSADAAATLRAANRLAERPAGPEVLRALALGLGSDVPSQLEPRAAVVEGVGERVEPVELPSLAIVLVPNAEGLSTAAVYAELDRLRDAGRLPARTAVEPEAAWRTAAMPAAQLAGAMENDLEAAALSLRPELAGTLDALVREGALGARITGSGPTAFGLFADRAAAEGAAARLPGALVVRTR